MLRDRVLNHPGTAAVHLDSTVEQIAAWHIITWHAPSGRSADGGDRCGGARPVSATQPGARRRTDRDVRRATPDPSGSVTASAHGNSRTRLLEGATVAASI